MEDTSKFYEKYSSLSTMTFARFDSPNLMESPEFWVSRNALLPIYIY